MLFTPQGTRYTNGYEQRMLVFFFPRLVRHILCRESYERNDIHYEGPELSGDGVFHSMKYDQKIVSLYLVLKNLGDQQNINLTAEWKNSALECVYAWMLYEVTQEIKTPETIVRNTILKVYQQVIDGNARPNMNSSNDLNYWVNIIDKLAATMIYSEEKWKQFFNLLEKEELFVTEELFNKATSYFEDSLANPTSYALPV